jgi:tetratricopeptide (TPR) repeat protein
MRKTVHYIILFVATCMLLAACGRRATDAERLLARIDSLADVNPDSADMLLKPTPIPSLKGRENEEVCKLLRIKTDDKLYRPVTHYRDTILQLIDYFEHHPKVLPSLLGSTGPALPYLYAGRIFADLGDAPQALDYFQQALNVQPATPSPSGSVGEGARLAKQRGLILSQIGEQFYFQGLYRDALAIFQEALCLAEQSNDTISIIFKNRDIAEQHKFLEKPDSSLYYYKKALEYATDYGDINRITELNSQMARLYKDQGQYHLARKYMQPAIDNLDSLNISSTYSILSDIYKNTNKFDSAYIYYNKLLQYGNIYGKYNAYKGLCELQLRKGDLKTAFTNFNQYKLLDDSIQEMDKAEMVARMHAAYNYQKHVKEAQRLKEANTLRGWLICLGILVLLVLLFLLLWVRAQARERKLRLQELHRIHEELQAKYALLTEDKANDHSYASRLAQLEKEKIWVSTRRIQESDVFKKLLQDPTCAVSNQEIWDEVERVVNEAYPGFSDRLRLLLPSISAKEKQVSLLLKAQLTHQLIAEIICETQNGESNIRRRLSKKLFPSETPSSSKFDDFIGSL